MTLRAIGRHVYKRPLRLNAGLLLLLCLFWWGFVTKSQHDPQAMAIYYACLLAFGSLLLNGILLGVTLARRQTTLSVAYCATTSFYAVLLYSMLPLVEA